MVVRYVECVNATSPSRLPGLDRALNPYRGCAHSCAYCYAQDVTRFEMSRPWGSLVEAKVNIVQLLKKELRKGPKGVYGVGTVTDPYQPIEKELELTRGCLRLLRDAKAETSILTKSDLVLRDLDILSGWSSSEVGMSVGVVDDSVAGLLEPGAPSPSRRFYALQRLSESGVRTYVMAAPIIGGVGDSEQSVVELVEKAGAAGTSRILWDKFNPKPLACSRLKKALEKKGIALSTGSPVEVERVRLVLRRECARLQIELLDAF